MVYIMGYVLDAVGKKPWKKRRINRSFQCEKERKTFTFFNRTLRLGYIIGKTGVPTTPTAPQGGVVTGIKRRRLEARVSLSFLSLS
jgi:hypothetical protein